MRSLNVIKTPTGVQAPHPLVTLRGNESGLPSHDLPSVESLVASLRPEEPLHCIRPLAITAAARAFAAGFPGDVLYAVKCNPEPAVLRAVWAGGIRHFDCASIAEVELVRRLFPAAIIHFMHPVKARFAIREAWTKHNVRDFILDSEAELHKILEETGQAAAAPSVTAERPGLFVRFALPETGAAINLSQKFGAEPEMAAALLRAARPVAARLGLAFHVGSQCLAPAAWGEAIAMAGEIIRAAGVPVEVLDIGGGFPVAYPDMEPPPLSAFMAEITTAYEALRMPGLRLWAEPGRALVGGGASVVVQVQLRRGEMLYINDGVYGALSDAGALRFRFPTRLIPARPRPGAPDAPFGFFGPTCDSLDVMRGPFFLPADVAEGDWIEIGQLGAYGACLRTGFNGFDRATLAEVRDGPMMGTPGYGPERE